MKTKLQQYFPMIRTRSDLLSKIQENEELLKTYNSWNTEQQEEFLDFSTGARGVKMLYDSFFKEIMNPYTTPSLLNEFLSLLLKRNIRIIQTIPNSSPRIADESSLLVMDIVVELDDGSLANIEVQKIAYAFPGQRCACYSADLLLRQYRRIRDRKKRRFSYKDIKTVYTIVLFEKSTGELHKFPDTYLHYFEQTSNSGLRMDLLQKYLLIPLDIFKDNLQNKGIQSKLDAWLAFMSCDEPEWIIKIISMYPEFKAMYEHVYEICLNVEKVMEMFSKELRELDRNTVQYMIDEMQEELNRVKEEREQLSGELDTLNEELTQKKTQLSEMDSQLSEKDSQLSEKDSQLSEKDKMLEEITARYEEAMKKIEELTRGK